MHWLTLLATVGIITGFPIGSGLFSVRQNQAHFEKVKEVCKNEDLSYLEGLSADDREKMVKLRNIFNYWGKELKFDISESNNRIAYLYSKLSLECEMLFGTIKEDEIVELSKKSFIHVINILKVL